MDAPQKLGWAAHPAEAVARRPFRPTVVTPITAHCRPASHGQWDYVRPDSSITETSGVPGRWRSNSICFAVHARSYPILMPADALTAWATLALAVATVLLAGITVTSVREAVLGRRDADFAHQESLTPIVKFESPTPNVSPNGTTLRIQGRLVNRGMGPALKVRMKYRERRVVHGPERLDFPVGEYGPIGPGESMPLMYEVERPDEEPYHGLPQSYVVTLEYENLFGTTGSTAYINGSTQPHFSRPPVRIR